MLEVTSKTFFHSLAQIEFLKRLASRYGMAPDGFARRFIAGESIEEAVEAVRSVSEQGLLLTLDYLGESVATAEEADDATREYRRILRVIVQSGIERNSRSTGTTRARRRPRDVGRQPPARPRATDRVLHPHQHGNSPYTDLTFQIWVLWGWDPASAWSAVGLMRSRDGVADGRTGARARVKAPQEPKAVAYQKKSEVDEPCT